MASVQQARGTIGILTGGGDVAGLNPAIRGIAVRALNEGYRVLGIRRGWAGLVDLVREDGADNSRCIVPLTANLVNRAAPTGGTFLHSTRVLPDRMPRAGLPEHLRDQYGQDRNDVTPEVLRNVEWLGIDHLVPIGGYDTLAYAVRLSREGVRCTAIPKTMDNDVPGTDYSIGFSTCVTRTITLANDLRTTAGSHERFLVMEVFGRFAGFTSMLPTMAGAANRCVIPEHEFDIEHLCELLSRDRQRNPSRYAVALVSEGARFRGRKEPGIQPEVDDWGRPVMGGIGDEVAARLQELSPKYNNGRRINVITQRLGYLVRGGSPDAIDSIVPTAFGNLAVEQILAGRHGRLVALRNGRYDAVPLELVTAPRKSVNVERHYNTERLRPNYERFTGKPLFVLTGDRETFGDKG